MPVPHASRREFLLQSAGGVGAIATAQAAAGAAGDGAAQTAPVPAPAPAPAPEPDGPVPVVTPVPGEPFVHAGPLVGHVGDTTARLWAKASNACGLGFRIGEDPSLADGRIIAGPTLAEAESFTGQVEVRELRPATRYHYCPLLDGRPALTRPYPSFVTAPAAGTRGRLRVAFGACVGRRAVHAAATFGEMAARKNFDLLMMLGDNHYGDTTDPAKLRDYYHMMRTVDGFTRLIREVPTYAVWDDHDYGPNNSDGTQPGKENSLRVFGQWWANPAAGEPGNPGCYFRFQRGDVEFFMLDVRYYRTPNDAPDGPTKTMLGARQLAWLLDGLAGSSAPFKVVAGGSEWQTLTQPDCWSSFARERQQIFDTITSRGIEGVVLLSGDRHFTAGYQVQGRHLEFTSGPIGSGNTTLKPNPERFTGADEGKLWTVLELDTTERPPRLAYEIWQAGGGLLERRELTYRQVCGRETIPASPFPLLPVRMEAKPGR
jgi:alkaline phosphatase D